MAKLGKPATPLSERIKNSIVVNDYGCWVWQKNINPGGYGSLSTGSRSDGTRKTSLAHRVAYEVFNAPIRQGRQIDHLCKNTACVNPVHLEQVTPKENIHRSNAVYKRLVAKTHCPLGHEYSSDNTTFSPTPSGGVSRSCKACLSIRTKDRYRLEHPDVREGMPLWAQLAARTHCNKGHEFSEKNTLRYGNSRRCRTCDSLNQKKRHQLRKTAEVA